MSGEQWQDRERPRKRDAVQKPFRQGWQWVERRFRSRSASPLPTRPSSPQTIGVSSSGPRPLHQAAARELDIPVPPTELVISADHLNHDIPPSGSGPASEDVPAPSSEDLIPLAQGSPYSSTNQSLESVYLTRIEDPLQDDSIPPSPEPNPTRTNAPVHALPRSQILVLGEDSAPTSLSGPVNNIQGTVVGNVFMGVNHGTFNMTFNMTEDNGDFTKSYAAQLRVCFRAEHMYYGNADEASLRRSGCTPGTRIDVLKGVGYWATDRSPNSEQVYWLSGQAGAGKTTIAYTVACQFEKPVSNGHSGVVLGASFFCSRQSLDTRSASSIVRTIVYQLALRSKSFQAALKQYGRFETVERGPKSQFMGLLAEPWEKSASERLAEDEPCYVISIDALDELEGTEGPEFLGTLFDIVEQQDLSGIKFFITSRSHPGLVKRMESFANKQVCRLEEVPLKETSADIKLYLSLSLAKCANEHQIQQLVSDAAGLFIYAATVVEFVKGRGVEEQKSLLKEILSPSSPAAHRRSRGMTATLDNLYLQILETCLVDPRDRNNPDVFQDCLSILHTFLCAIEPTSPLVAVDILNASSGDDNVDLDTGVAEGVLHRLHAVLYSQGGKVMFFHKSFSDFLHDQGRSPRFFCNPEQYHHRLGEGCFELMREHLRFNIADISSSYHLDCDNPALAASLNTNISAPLRYACVNWSSHLALTSLELLAGFARILDKFFQLPILFWMEAMNLLGQRGCCQRMLRDTQRLFLKIMGATGLNGKLADAAAFAAYHSMSKATLSTPHLYISSLATFPRHSTIVQKWRQQFGGIAGFISAEGVGAKSVVACIAVGGSVYTLAVSPDGTNFAVGSPDWFVRIMDLSTGNEVRVLEGHKSRVEAVAYSLDGNHVASGSFDKTVRVWDLSTGEMLRVLEGHTSEVNAVACSPDGNRIVSGSSDKTARVWDLSTGEVLRVLEGHTEGVNAVAYSSDGTHVVSGSEDRTVRVWDPSTGKLAMILQHTGNVTAVACSPVGTRIVSASDKLIRVWNSLTGEMTQAIHRDTRRARMVAFSPDGTHLVSSSIDYSVQEWNLATREVSRVLEGHTNLVYAVAYSPDGAHVISGSLDKSVRVWDLSTRGEVRLHAGAVTAVAYSPNGSHVVSASSDSVTMWDLSTGEAARFHNDQTGTINTVAYSPDGAYVVSGSWDGSVRLWDTCSGENVRVLGKNHGLKVVDAVAYSPDGTHVASGSFDRSVRVWNLSTGQEVSILRHTSWVRAVAYSPDGTHVASGSRDNTIRVWDLSTGQEAMILKPDDLGVNAIAYSPDGNCIVSCSHSNAVRVWDLSTGAELSVFAGHTGEVRSVAYSPDGTSIASGSGDHSVRVWDLSTGGEVKVIKGHADCVLSVAYSPDGTRIVTGSEDKSVRVWDISPHHIPRYICQKNTDGEHTGWLLSPTDSSVHLMFVPPPARLPDDCNVLAFPKSAVPYLDLSNAKLGDRWAECYTPTSL